ncbi:lysosomal alpha-glucosidase-like [Glandiceps talaboti]
MEPKPKAASCTVTEPASRFDCHPETGVTQKRCESRGCCWNPIFTESVQTSSNKPPDCYYPSDFPSYSITDNTQTPFGHTANLERQTTTHYGKDILKLQMDVYLESESRLHFKIFDPNRRRYEIPLRTPKPTSKSLSQSYTVEFEKEPFSFRVKRAENQKVLFDTSISTFIFSDQFIQISTSLPSHYLYGLGEHLDSLLLDMNWTNKTLWARDIIPKEDTNLYGSHPFYMVMEGDGNAHGVFLFNSNAMDVTLQPTPALTYRTIGGILDFYIFLGPSPTEVIQQYTEIIGRPFMPPYWSLGFHICRYGYGSLEKTNEVVKETRAAGIPQDVQWHDIDSMDKFLDFTFDPDKFSQLPQFIEDIHQHNQYYVTMLDPAISSSQPKGTYQPFDDGMSKDIFIKNASGSLLVAKVWPGETAFPDFTNPNTSLWWAEQIATLHKKIPFDGLWNDMNEPSSFLYGSVDGCPANNTYENPPYLPAVSGGSLITKTICMTARHKWNRHYDVHNLYGLSNSIATYNALAEMNKRPFVLSRSTFPSSGKYAAHWTGDILSTWKHMYYTIPGILNFNMFGVPMVGADICGFGGNTTEQLCQRWQQLGAFYPFARNHNDIKANDQHPTVFSEAMQNSTRKALLIRYSLLPYLYTLFYKAHTDGSPVVRPLFFEYPKDKMTYSIDTQFLWGEALMITPVLNENATSVEAYFPDDDTVWYDYYTGAKVKRGRVELEAPMDTINLHIQGGYIIPTQEPATTTKASRNNTFGLIVALSNYGRANGSLFWDDGETLGTIYKKLYESVVFTTGDDGSLSSTVLHDGYPEAGKMILSNVKVLGVLVKPGQVIANGEEVNFSYGDESKVLHITGLVLPLNKEFVIMVI